MIDYSSSTCDKISASIKSWGRPDVRFEVIKSCREMKRTGRTLLSLKSLNRSLKSELTNIQSLDLSCVEREFPGRCCACRCRLTLPELEIK